MRWGVGGGLYSVRGKYGVPKVGRGVGQEGRGGSRGMVGTEKAI